MNGPVESRQAASRLHPVRRSLRLAAGLVAFSAPAFAAWQVTDIEPITRSGEAVSPVVSPDGRRVAYVVGTRLPVTGGPDAITGRVWVMDRANRQAERMGRLSVDLVAGESPAAFAADGAYAYIEGPRSSPILWYVNADGTRFQVGPGRSASFSPDGQFLAYTVWDRSGSPAVELRLFDTRKRESKPLSGAPVKEMPRMASVPCWTPNAERIVYMAGGNLYSYARYTGRLTALAKTGDAEAFDVMDDSRVLFYRRSTEMGDGGLWTAGIVSRSLSRVVPSEELPPGIGYLMATPDGQGALFVADTARGRGLVAADLRTGRWRYIAAAEAAALQRGGPLVALETAGPEGKRNIAAGSLSYKPSVAVPLTSARQPGTTVPKRDTRR